MLFWKKKSAENVDLTLKEEVRVMKSKLTRLESEVLDIITSLDIIRNKVLRKIQIKKDINTEDESEEWGGIPKT